MSALLSMISALGWRGGVAAVVAATVAAGAAYPAGRLVGAAVCGARVDEALSARDVKRIEMENAALRKAHEARHAADRNSDTHDAGSVPDDGFRRD
ncbi:MAG: hypothetical protein AAF318_11140 [Pseudomonadota bacterium]